jgi:hypothetical protein
MPHGKRQFGKSAHRSTPSFMAWAVPWLFWQVAIRSAVNSFVGKEEDRIARMNDIHIVDVTNRRSDTYW